MIVTHKGHLLSPMKSKVYARENFERRGDPKFLEDHLMRHIITTALFLFLFPFHDFALVF